MKYEVLKARLARTLAGPPLEAETVVGACEILAREILDGKYDQVLEASLGAEMDRPQGANPVMAQARRAARLLSRPCLEERLRWELPRQSGSSAAVSEAATRQGTGR